MTQVQYKEIIWLEMKPDVYAGDPCGSEMEPLFEAAADGDMGEEFLNSYNLEAKNFPSGTKITIEVPCCPKCLQESDLCSADDSCDFNWQEWTLDMYS